MYTKLKSLNLINSDTPCKWLACEYGQLWWGVQMCASERLNRKEKARGTSVEWMLKLQTSEWTCAHVMYRVRILDMSSSNELLCVWMTGVASVWFSYQNCVDEFITIILSCYLTYPWFNNSSISWCTHLMSRCCSRVGLLRRRTWSWTTCINWRSVVAVLWLLCHDFRIIWLR